MENFKSFLAKESRGRQQREPPWNLKKCFGIRWGRAWGLLTFFYCAPWHVAHVSFGPRAVFKMRCLVKTHRKTHRSATRQSCRHRWASGRNAPESDWDDWVCYNRRYAAIQDVRHGRKSSKIPYKGAKCISVQILWWSMAYGFIPQTCWLACIFVVVFSFLLERGR